MVGVCYFGSVLEVGQFVFRFLRKEVVGEANRQLAIAMQFVHHAIVVGIVLKSASSINGTRDAKAIQFPEEEPRRIKLVFPGELGALGQRGIKDVGIRFGDEKTRRISVTVTLNFTRRKFCSILVLTYGTKRRCIQ